MKYKFAKAFHDAKKKADEYDNIKGGYKVLFRVTWWRLVPVVIWDFLTACITYLPASDYHLFICKAVNKKWSYLSVSDQQKILAALIRLDQHGEITDIIDKETEQEISV